MQGTFRILRGHLTIIHLTLYLTMYTFRKVLDEKCSRSSECADPSAECKNAICVCGQGFRKRTTKEFWSDPDAINECVEVATNLGVFSLLSLIIEVL